MGIRVGTCVHGDANAAEYIKQILPHGFESFELTFSHRKFDLTLDLEKIGNDIQASPCRN